MSGVKKEVSVGTGFSSKLYSDLIQNVRIKLRSDFDNQSVLEIAMQHILNTLIAVVAVLIAVRFVVIARKEGEAGFSRACWESIGWLLLSSVVVGPVLIVVEFQKSIRNIGDHRLREKVALRKEFPMESLATRLQYESAYNQIQADTDIGEISTIVEQRLVSIENQSKDDWRSRDLQRLHDHETDEFLKNPGFGVIRMRGVHKEDIELPESPPVLFNEPGRSFLPYVPDVSNSDAVPLADTSSYSLETHPDKNALTTYHDSGISEFLAPIRMGYVEDREHVAGFQSHRFDKAPPFPASEPYRDKWRVVRLELVSLLRHKTPVAYLSKHLPRMDELAEAPTRPLNAMESLALSQLRREQDIVIENEPNTIRMLGSIRAGKTCLSCHSVRRGELLGEFSYELHRLKPVEHKKRPKNNNGPTT